MVKVGTFLFAVFSGILLVANAYADSQGDARKALEAKGIQVSEGEFLRQVERGDRTVVELFLQAGINPKAKVDGGSALIVATTRGHADIVQMLIAKGADVNARNKEGATPLMGAIMGGRKDIVSLLLDRGADVNASTATTTQVHAITPLFMAIPKGDKDFVQLLITRGADVNKKGNVGGGEMSPLTWALVNKKQEIADLLITKGARP